MAHLSQNFQRSEFQCQCGCGCDTVDSELVKKLQQIRDYFGRSIRVTSAHRCPAHNKAVGGAENSQHVQARAADIQIDGVPPRQVQDYAKELGLSVGSYDTFTHVDTRTDGPVYWEG